MPTQAEVDLHDPLLPLRLSAEVALLEQELAIRDAVNRALEQWLPIATTAVLEGGLTAAVGPDPGGITLAASLWTHAVDGELQPTIGAVFQTAVETARPDWVGLELLPIKSMRDEYWVNVQNRLSGLPAELYDLLTNRLNSELDAGTSTTKLADVVKSVLSVAGLKNEVTRIARTEATGAFNAGTLGAWQYSAKLTGEELDKVWIATRDLRTREAHRHADEQRVDLFAPFLVDGFPMPCPGWPVAPPELVINCRCSMIELAKGESMPAVKRKPWSEVDSQAEATARPAPAASKQSASMTELKAHVARWQPDQTGLDPLLAAVDSGYRPDDVQTLAGYESNPDRWVARIKYANGTEAFVKRSAVEDIEREQLSSYLGQKLGVPVAPVLRIQEDEYVSQLIPGTSGAEWYDIADKAVTGYNDPVVRAAADRVGDSNVAGRRLSFFDVLIEEGDRHLWDVNVDDNGHAVGGFDQEFAWPPPDQGFDPKIAPSRYLNRIGSLWYDVNPDPNEENGVWKTNPLTEADVAWLRARMKEARPEFRRLGRDDWWQYSWTRLQTMARYAGGTTNLFAPVTAGAVFHLPGRHDQHTHGRRGAGISFDDLMAAPRDGAQKIFEGTFGRRGLKAVVRRAGVSWNDDTNGRGVLVSGTFQDSRGKEAGQWTREFRWLPDGTSYVRHERLDLEPEYQRAGTAHEFNANAYASFRQMGFDHVRVGATSDGKVAWAREGFDFRGKDAADRVTTQFVNRGRKIAKTDEEKALIEAVGQRIADHEWGQPGYPTAQELVFLGRHDGDKTWLGLELMAEGPGWKGWLPLRSADG